MRRQRLHRRVPMKRAAFAKKPPKRQAARRDCVALVRARDEDTCRVCGRNVQYLYPGIESFGAVHEIVFRSRGGDPTDPTNGVLLCDPCHRDVHAHRVRLSVRDAAVGADGDLVIERRAA